MSDVITFIRNIYLDEDIVNSFCDEVASLYLLEAPVNENQKARLSLLESFKDSSYIVEGRTFTTHKLILFSRILDTAKALDDWSLRLSFTIAFNNE